MTFIPSFMKIGKMFLKLLVIYIYKHTGVIFVACTVKLSLCLIKHHAMKTYWEVLIYHHTFLSIGEGEWSASRPGHFSPQKKLPVPIG